MSRLVGLLTVKENAHGASKEKRYFQAQAEVGVSLAQAQQWFLSLKDYPQRYRFATHEGVTFVAGDFGEVGARFLHAGAVSWGSN